VVDERFRSRMQVVFTVKTGSGADADLVEKFITEAETAGWVDVRSHPLGVDSPSIRITMYNAQPIETVAEIRAFMQSFMEKNK
jgi:phosphoserine aminotransferase